MISIEQFYLGESFHRVANEIIPPDFLENETDDGHWFVPYIVNISFACELYLKCVLSQSEVQYRNSHNLKTLFLRLPDFIKHRITNSPCFLGDDEFMAKLEENSELFAKWRYFYEQTKRISVELVFLENFAVLLHQIAQEIILNET